MDAAFEHYRRAAQHRDCAAQDRLSMRHQLVNLRAYLPADLAARLTDAALDELFADPPEATP